MKLSFEPFDFQYTIQSLTNLYLSQCQKKGVSFDTKLLTPVDDWLIGDQLRLNQIIINLLNNAVKFTERGHIILTISQHDTQDETVFVRFAVEDTGCGMSEDMQARLFKPFEQESAGTAQKYGGSGLGLSIVKNLVTMMNGAICVKSQKGVGTTFFVDLPFSRTGKIKEEIKLDGIENLNVLVVDDEEYERKYISIVLDRIGVCHTCVESGDAALTELEQAFAANTPYNICLIDWKMPNETGVEVTKRVREHYGEDVVVIVVSAYEHNQANDQAKQAGANLFLSKPLFQSSLFNLFMRFTGGQLGGKRNLR